MLPCAIIAGVLLQLFVRKYKSDSDYKDRESTRRIVSFLCFSMMKDPSSPRDVDWAIRWLAEFAPWYTGIAIIMLIIVLCGYFL